MPSAAVITNLVESASAITSSTEDSNWPLANLYDRIAAKPFKFTSATGAWIQIDFGSSLTPDTLAIINHDASSATVTIKGDNSNPPTTVLATPSHQDGEIWADLGDSVNARYIRIEFSGVLVVGELIIGTRIVLPRAHRFGKIPGHGRSDINHETIGRVSYVTHLAKQELREYTWRVLLSELTNFETIEEGVKGRTHPYLWIPDTSGTEVIYARNMESDYRPQELADPMAEAAYDLSWKLKAESYGIALES